MANSVRMKQILIQGRWLQFINPIIKKGRRRGVKDLLALSMTNSPTHMQTPLTNPQPDYDAQEF